MANGNSRGIWQILFGVSATACLALTGMLIANITGSGQRVTKDDLNTSLLDLRQDMKREIIATLRYPWLDDKKLVMNHISEGEKHESDRQKRVRIREELDYHLGPIHDRLSRIESALNQSFVIPRSPAAEPDE